MSDTPSFEEVAGAAIDSQASSTEPLQVSESSEPTTETATPEGQGAEQQTQEESFSTFNPNDLPPELQTVYKRWQGDYTRTRQKEKAELKELQEKLANYEKQASVPSNSQINNSYEAGIQNGQIDPKMSLADYTQLVKEQTKSEIKAEMKTEQENTYIESQEKEFYNLDPRFPESPDQDKVLLNFVAGELGAMRDAYEAENGSVVGFDFIGNAKTLISQYDERISKSNKAFIAKQSEAARANASQSAKAMPKAVNSSGKPSGKVSFEDAASAAWEKNAN